MVLDQELITNWRSRWLSCINELTDFPLQQAAWLDAQNTNPHWSFVEFMCKYFDDLGLEDYYQTEIKEGLVTAEEVAVILPWHLLLDQYQSPNNKDWDDKAVLEDPHWQSILQEGLKALPKLKPLLSPEEFAILTEKIDYRDYL